MINLINEEHEVFTHLGKNKAEGSSVYPGHSYQNILGTDVPCHRDNSHIRGNRIAELVDVRGKTVLDLGCNVGTITSVLNSHGATVVGVDHDEASIAVANHIWSDSKDLGVRIPNFEIRTIDLDYIRSLKHFDIIVWLSQFNWLVKQHDMGYAMDCLWEIGKHCDTLVFETAGKDDGCAPIEFTQEQVFRILAQNTIFRKIRNTGQWNDCWTPRDVYVCEMPLIKHDGLFAEVYPGERGQLIKKFADNEFAQELKTRTVNFLIRKNLGPFKHFPGFIKQLGNEVYMTWEGPWATFIPEQDIFDILSALDEKDIEHRDINPENVLFNGFTTVLIDFAFAVQRDEIVNTSHDLGGKFKCPHGFNDEYSLRKVQQYLLNV